MANTTEEKSSSKSDKAAERVKLEKLFGVEAGTCLSGSGVSPKKGLFAPGGDAKLKSRLLTEFRTGNATVKAKAEKQADALGWSRFLTPAPAAKPKADKPEKAAKTTKKAAKPLAVVK